MNEFYAAMKGTTYFTDIEENLEVDFSFSKCGYVILNGRYKERLGSVNELRFEFECTQPDLFSVISLIDNISL